MYKFRLALICLLMLICFVSSQLFSATTATTNQPLSPDEFIKAVDDNNVQVQSGLDATLAQLLGAAPQVGLTPTTTSATSTDTLATPPPVETPPANNSSTTTTSPPANSGFNPYAN